MSSIPFRNEVRLEANEDLPGPHISPIPCFHRAKTRRYQSPLWDGFGTKTKSGTYSNTEIILIFQSLPRGKD